MDLNKFIEDYGLSVGIVIWVIIGAARLLKNEIPNLIAFFKDERVDSREHRQKLEQDDAAVKRMEYLTAMGSRTFTEEQLTTMTAEAQSQLGEANEFIRRDLANRIDIINQQLIQLKEVVSTLSDEIYDKVRPDLRQVAENWKAAMLDYRHIQTKISIMVTLIEEFQRGNRKNDSEGNQDI